MKNTIAKSKRDGDERDFVVELNSGSDLKNVNYTDWAQRILLEGTIGALRRVDFVEDGVLELVGTDGVLRVDLSKQDLTEVSQNRFLQAKKTGSARGDPI